MLYGQKSCKVGNPHTVGGGTAGCVIARRLSDQCNCSILVVEAGDLPSWFMSIPMMAPMFQLTHYDWAYKTVPQHHSQWGMNNKVSFWPRGRVLGGSSNINYLLHMWATRSDFDKFSDVVGDETWSYQRTKPFFKKSEYLVEEDSPPFPDKKNTRGQTGFIPFSRFPIKTSQLASAFQKSVESFGIKHGDINAVLDIGVMASESNIKRGRRITTFHAYLKPILDRSNIAVMIRTMTTKIIFRDKEAVAVRLQKTDSETSFVVKAHKEVIVCAGAIGSPHLLMVSGIGSAEELQRHNITVVANLSGVGQNLRDHLNLPMYFHLTSPISMNLSKLKSLRQLWKYFRYGKGYFAGGGVEVIARGKSPDSQLNQSDFYFMLLNVGSVYREIYQPISNLKPEIFSESFPDSKNESKEGFFLLSTCSCPKSRGFLVLKSANPFIRPHIDPRYLEHKDDIRCFLNAMRLAAKIGNSTELQKLGSRLHLPNFKHCRSFEANLDNDKYLRCWLRTAAMTAYHPTSTCAMGKDNDSLAVLDSHFKVRTVGKLRVVDSSALPISTSGTPHFVVVVMAERAAEWIIRDEKSRKEVGTSHSAFGKLRNADSTVHSCH